MNRRAERNRAWRAVGAVGACIALASVLVAATGRTQEPAGDRSPRQDSERVARYRAAAEESGRPIDHYNLGTALLREGRWAEARGPLQLASRSDRERVRQNGQYNFGVASGMTGRDGEAAPDARHSALLAARQAFRQVLRVQPEAGDARWNLELIERWLEEAEQEAAGAEGAGAPQTQQQGQGAQPEPGAGEPRSLTPEEAAALLEAAGQAEESVRDRFLGRNRFREPVVDRNW